MRRSSPDSEMSVGGIATLVEIESFVGETIALFEILSFEDQGIDLRVLDVRKRGNSLLDIELPGDDVSDESGAVFADQVNLASDSVSNDSGFGRFSLEPSNN